jgi:NAD(P)-dependent dehydrogenase (short-subunit alcohol dehydrogenase family)
MSTVHASQLLRPGLLQGVSVVLAGAPSVNTDERGSFGEAVRKVCAGLGACVHEVSGERGDETGTERAAQAVAERAIADGGVDSLVIDSASVFARSAADGREAMGDCLVFSWNVTRAVANSAFIPNGRGGRIVYLAPSDDMGGHANAARAGLENLARTLSIEWARHAVTTVAIASGPGLPDEVAALTAYLASPAGAYYSGCLLQLRRPDDK